MGIQQKMVRDFSRFTSNENDFGVSIVFTSPDSVDTATIVGYTVKHHTAFDEMGVKISNKIAAVMVSELLLIGESYPVRNTDGNVYLLNHIVDVTDSNENISRYRVVKQFPDETLGSIVLILGEIS